MNRLDQQQPTNRRMRAFAIGCIAALVFGSASAAVAEPIVMRISLVSAPGSIEPVGLSLMEQYVEQSLPGQIDVQVYAGSTLFKQSQQISAIQRGSLESTVLQYFDVTSRVPEASILTAAYVIRDAEHACAILNSDFGQALLAKIEAEMGMKVLSQNFIGSRTLVLRESRDVHTPQDISDLTMREIGTSSWQFQAEALGAKPTPIAYSELYLALQTGTVDAYASSPSNIIEPKLHEVSAQVVLTRHYTSTWMLVVSKTFWDSLNDEQQDVVQEGARVASEFSTNNRLRAEAGALQELEAVGLEITTPDIEAFRAHAEQRYLGSEFADAWPDGLYETLKTLPTDPNCVR